MTCCPSLHFIFLEMKISIPLKAELQLLFEQGTFFEPLGFKEIYFLKETSLFVL